ncbi:MAG: hypothetical protein ACLF0P_07005 [Thermoanaerobaculia bacterium]
MHPQARPLLFLLSGCLAAGPVTAARALPAETQPPENTPEASETAPEPVPAEASEVDQPVDQRERSLIPELNVYFPEGELDLRVNRLVKKVFVEGQVRYNFVDGDISAFLRYRYYGYERTYQLTVFDEVAFQDIEDFSSDFDRVRGILLLTEWPHSFHHRTFLLTELDRISSNKEEFVFDTGKTNLFARLGYQIGTPNDERSNAIVGEDRARVERLFTAFRQVGPGDAGLTGALTWGTDLAVGDFDYMKLEFAGLKRFELPRGVFLLGRLNGGTFFRREELDRDIDPGGDLPRTGRFSIPREEFFRLDGRDNLKGLDERLRGTEELHTTWELVFPWFVDEPREAIRLDWTNWYWVLYAGAGTIGFERDVYTELEDYVTDFGAGFEASFELRDYEFFLSALVAQAFNAEGGVQLRLSLKTYH